MRNYVGEENYDEFISDKNQNIIFGFPVDVRFAVNIL